MQWWREIRTCGAGGLRCPWCFQFPALSWLHWLHAGAPARNWNLRADWRWRQSLLMEHFAGNHGNVDSYQVSMHFRLIGSRGLFSLVRRLRRSRPSLPSAGNCLNRGAAARDDQAPRNDSDAAVNGPPPAEEGDDDADNTVNGPPPAEEGEQVPDNVDNAARNAVPPVPESEDDRDLPWSDRDRDLPSFDPSDDESSGDSEEEEEQESEGAASMRNPSQ